MNRSQKRLSKNKHQSEMEIEGLEDKGREDVRNLGGITERFTVHLKLRNCGKA